MKQMRLLTDGSFTKAELESYRQLVFTNLISGMKALVECLSEVGLTIEDDKGALDAYRVNPVSPLLRRTARASGWHRPKLSRSMSVSGS
jgi:hypothetical protein